MQQRLKTTLILLTLTLLGVANVNAQTNKDLDSVPKVGQKSENWCWAASMEMIFRHYDFQIDQCSVAKTYFKRQMLLSQDGINHMQGETVFHLPDSDIGKSLDLDNKCANWCATKPSVKFFNTLPFNFDTLGSGKYSASYYDMLFSDLDFYSIEDIKPLTWNRYKAEIDNKRPVLLNYSLTDMATTAGSTFDHAVVAKGYIEGTPNSYLIINDPLSVCNGRQYLLNKAVLDGIQASISVDNDPKYDTIPNELKISRIYSMVHGIRPKNPTQNPFHSPNPVFALRMMNIGENDSLKAVARQPLPPPLNPLADIIKEAGEKFIGSAFEGTFSEEQIKTNNPDGQFTTEIDFISYNNLTKFWSQCSLEKGTLSQFNTKEVTYTQSSPEIKAVIHCTKNGGDCMIEKIEYQEDTGVKRVEIDGEEIELNNRISGENNVSYRVAKALPYPFEFYTVKVKEEQYFIPKDEYAKAIFNGIESGDKLIAYPEREAFKKLIDYTEEFPWKNENINNNWIKIIIGLMILIILTIILILTTKNEDKEGLQGTLGEVILK